MLYETVSFANVTVGNSCFLAAISSLRSLLGVSGGAQGIADCESFEAIDCFPQKKERIIVGISEMSGAWGESGREMFA